MTAFYAVTRESSFVLRKRRGILPVSCLRVQKVLGGAHDKRLFFGGAGVGAYAAAHTIVRGNLYAESSIGDSHCGFGNKILGRMVVIGKNKRSDTGVRANERTLIALNTIFRYPLREQKGCAVLF